MSMPPPPPRDDEKDSFANDEYSYSRYEARSDESFAFESDHERRARNWGMLCHLAALSAFIGVPFGHLVGPLLVWLIKRKEYAYVDEQGRESLNFQISMTIYSIVAGVLILVVIGVFLLIALAILNIVAVVVASIRANDGRPIRYPLTIRFL